MHRLEVSLVIQQFGIVLVFLDEEEYNNIELRKMIHLLPESLHWLTLSTGLTIEERENKVREWIKTIIEHVSTLNN